MLSICRRSLPDAAAGRGDSRRPRPPRAVRSGWSTWRSACSCPFLAVYESYGLLDQDIAGTATPRRPTSTSHQPHRAHRPGLPGPARPLPAEDRARRSSLVAAAVRFLLGLVERRLHIAAIALRRRLRRAGLRLPAGRPAPGAAGQRARRGCRDRRGGQWLQDGYDADRRLPRTGRRRLRVAGGRGPGHLRLARRDGGRAGRLAGAWARWCSATGSPTSATPDVERAGACGAGSWPTSASATRR